MVLCALLALACGSDGRPPTPRPTETAGPRADPVTARATFYGARAGDSASAAVPGDFNGDGASDLVLASAVADGPEGSRVDAGEAYLFLGPFGPGDERDAANGDQALTVRGAAGDQLGRAMTSGDFNGDGLDDIVIAAPFGDGPADGRPDAGEVYVLMGGPDLGVGQSEVDLTRQPADLTVYGRSGGSLAGFALGAADVNGDALDDLIIGAFWADGPQDARADAGEVYVVAGAEALPEVLDLAEDPPSTIVYGAVSGDRLGEEVSAGDFDGDGIDDLILPAPFAAGSRDATGSAGQTYVITGPPPAVVDIAEGGEQLVIYGVDTGDQFGHSLGTGDGNGDGRADVLLAAVSANGPENELRLAGEAALIAGRKLDPGSRATVDIAAGDEMLLVYGSYPQDRLGRSAAMGDVNGDGLADLLMGAPGGDGEDGSRSATGEIFIVAGSRSPSGIIELGRGQADAVIEGLDAVDGLGSEVFGRPVLLVTDMDGDGTAEVVASASGGDGPENRRADCGEAYILFLR